MIKIEARGEYPTIKYQNSFRYTGEELERMKRTPIPPDAGVGSQLENLGAKVDVRYAPEEVATQSDLGPDEQKQRIEALNEPFNRAVCRVVASLQRRPDDEVRRALAGIRSFKSHILEGKITSEAAVRERA